MKMTHIGAIAALLTLAAAGAAQAQYERYDRSEYPGEQYNSVDSSYLGRDVPRYEPVSAASIGQPQRLGNYAFNRDRFTYERSGSRGTFTFYEFRAMLDGMMFQSASNDSIAVRIPVRIPAGRTLTGFRSTVAGRIGKEEGTAAYIRLYVGTGSARRGTEWSVDRYTPYRDNFRDTFTVPRSVYGGSYGRTVYYDALITLRTDRRADTDYAGNVRVTSLQVTPTFR